MIPATTVIVAALVSAASAAAKDLTSDAIKSAYTSLKTLIIDKFGDKANVENAIEFVETRPDSEARRAMLVEELGTAEVGRDSLVEERARELLDLLEKEGLAAGASYDVEVSDSGAAAAGEGAVAAGAGGIAIGGGVKDSAIIAGNENIVNPEIEKFFQTMVSKNADGDYIERQQILQIFLQGSEIHEALLNRLLAGYGVDKSVLQGSGPKAAPDHIGRQIEEVEAAQHEAAAQGVPTTPQAAYRLGMLAAYRRDYESALQYFSQATQAAPDYSDAYMSIAALQQSRAMDDIHHRDYDAAVRRLAIARNAAEKTDPLNAGALALRGYIAKTLAQISEGRKDMEGRGKYYKEAARMFEGAAHLDPNDPSAQNGLGNVQHAMGNLDAAITAYKQAVALLPRYTAAHHDLALAYEGKMSDDPSNATKWCKQALAEWRETYRLAPEDSGFSAEYILQIGQRINWFEQQCG